MIRFTSDELRPLFTQNLGMQRPLILEKKLGIYLRVPDDRCPGEWLKAWAAGCNPSKDADWFTRLQFESGDGRYAWLNYTFAIGILTMHEGKIMIDAYRLTNFPGREIGNVPT